MVSYARKCDIYFRVLSNNPEISANEIGRRYAGTKYAMRKQDRNDFVQGAKSQIRARETFGKNIAKSDMTPETQDKLMKVAKKAAYRSAKSNTRKSKAEAKPGDVTAGVKDLEKRTFNRIPDYGDRDFIQFYG